MEGFDARARAKGYSAIAGVDEAGRGPLAGPVVAAAVILPPRFRSKFVRDSKSLSPAGRRKAYSLIAKKALSLSFALCTHQEIDELNIYHATLLAMHRAVQGLSLPPDFLYVDGNRPVPCGIAQETLVAGDSRCYTVMAAGIIAKVTRDRMMEEFDREYPGYGFSNHKGYTTKEHLNAIRLLGPCPIHRRSFKWVKPED